MIFLFLWLLRYLSPDVFSHPFFSPTSNHSESSPFPGGSIQHYIMQQFCQKIAIVNTFGWRCYSIRMFNNTQNFFRCGHAKVIFYAKINQDYIFKKNYVGGWKGHIAVRVFAFYVATEVWSVAFPMIHGASKPTRNTVQNQE